ncbi:MAG: TonB-dependent receptor [Betaproteobacteria bacterium]|nr:TonB-dependent receptor [Betaproteobacteria bacterium]
MRVGIPLAICMALLFTSALPVAAQEKAISLETVVVIGERIEPEAIAKPLNVMDPDELARRQATTLGETLRGLPGVSATGFGPNASRPVIRGQDGDRIKILQNSSPTNDLSGMSFDHAVAVSPYALEQVEILRGPSALLYGGSAAGGVVNMVNRRILRSRLDEASRSVDVRVDGANDNRQGAFELESQVGDDWFLHLDGFAQKSGETRTPLFTDGDSITGRRIRNSAAESNGVGLGLSKVRGANYWGFSIESDQSNYGVPKETSTRIDMSRQRLSFAANQALDGLFDLIRVRAGVTDYQHKELSDSVTSSTFKNQANDIRLELSHRPVGGWKGLVGLQWEYSDLNVLPGAEDPLMPRTRSPKLGLFALEEASIGPGRLRVGGRIEQAQVEAERTFSVVNFTPVGSTTTDGAARTRSFNPLSASVEYSVPLATRSSLSTSLSHVQRAPSNYELFATGVHGASGLFEVGNANLNREKGNHLDLTLTHLEDKSRLKASVFYSSYSNYITLIRRAGITFAQDGETYPVYDSSGVAAKFYGAELELSTSLKQAAWTISPRLTYDYLIGKDVSNDAYIPRQTPQRLTPSLDLRSGPWLVRGEVQMVGKAKLGENETVQAGSYSLVNVLAEHQHRGITYFIKGTNLTNQLAFNANTVDAVRQYVPLAGRAAMVGMRAFF